MTTTAPRIVTGYGWKRILLDTGEVIEMLALNGDLPQRFERPIGSGHFVKIAEVLGDAPIRD